MTVQHLKNLKNQQNTGKSNSSFPELFASDSNFMIMMRGFGSLCCCDVTDQSESYAWVLGAKKWEFKAGYGPYEEVKPF